MIVEVCGHCDDCHLCRVVALRPKLVAMAVMITQLGLHVLFIGLRGPDGKVYDDKNAEIELRLIASGARYG